MHEQNGMNIGYEFLTRLRNHQIDSLDIFRFIWKGIYEKRDAVIEIAIYQKTVFGMLLSQMLLKK